MRIKWRGLELPSRVSRDDAVSTDDYGRLIIEPFERGFGTTIGNSIRRVLLSSLEGAAITSVKMDGVAHEFMSVNGVLEDVTDIILNIKGVVLTMDSEEPKKLVLHKDRAGEVCAGDLQADASVQIVNADHHIATLTSDVVFHAEMVARTGRGYATAGENRTPDMELGVIAVESIFSPVRRVRYSTEDMRVGQRTNYDRLTLEVWTNGTLLPEDALVEAGLILRKHLNPFVLYHELGTESAGRSKAPVIPVQITGDSAFTHELLDQPISALALSVRANNCLEAARIRTIRELVSRTEAELLRFRSFGKTSLHEVQRKLAEVGLKLGMQNLAATQPSSEISLAADSMKVGSAHGTYGNSDILQEGDEGAVSAGDGSPPARMEVFTMPD
ncbi:MAG: DNA-directed RNA polymerase subunit alpha [Planctomycetota bacterium]